MSITRVQSDVTVLVGVKYCQFSKVFSWSKWNDRSHYQHCCWLNFFLFSSYMNTPREGDLTNHTWIMWRTYVLLVDQMTCLLFKKRTGYSNSKGNVTPVYRSHWGYFANNSGPLFLTTSSCGYVFSSSLSLCQWCKMPPTSNVSALMRCQLRSAMLPQWG